MAGALAHRIMWRFVRSQSTYSNTRLAGVRIWYDLGGCSSFSTVGEDPDTHHDFKPVNKAPNDILSAHQLVEKDIKENPVMLYMKGVPDAPRCGFSASAVKVLQYYGVPFSARNILEDKELKESIKSFRLVAEPRRIPSAKKRFSHQRRCHLEPMCRLIRVATRSYGFGAIGPPFPRSL